MEELLPSSTAVVRRMASGVVEKVHPTTQRELHGDRLRALQPVLAKAGVRTPKLLGVSFESHLHTRWEGLGKLTPT